MNDAEHNEFTATMFDTEGSLRIYSLRQRSSFFWGKNSKKGKMLSSSVKCNIYKQNSSDTTGFILFKGPVTLL